MTYLKSINKTVTLICKSVCDHVPILSEEYLWVKKPRMFVTVKRCNPASLSIYSGSSHIVVNKESSWLLASTFKNQAVNLNYKSLPEKKVLLLMYFKVYEV